MQEDNLLIKTKELKVGMVFKNYKCLCECLGENVRTGQSKILQVKNWNRYFEFTRNKSSIIISKIYDNPIKKDIFTKHSKYAQDIADILIYLLKQNDNHLLNFKKELMCSLGLVNENFKQDKRKCNLNLEINNSYKYHYSQMHYQIHSLIGGSVLNTTLKSLEEKNIIVVKNFYMIFKNNQSKVGRIANEIETNNINTTIKDTLLKFECKNERDIYLKGKSIIREYSKLINEKFINNYGYYNVLKLLDIVLVEQGDYNNVKIKNDNEYLKIKNELNVNILNKIKKSNKRKFDKQKELKFDNSYEGQENIFMFKDNYVEIQNKLADYYIIITNK